MNEEEIEKIWNVIYQHGETIIHFTESIIHFAWVFAGGMVIAVITGTLCYTRIMNALKDVDDFKKEFKKSSKEMHGLKDEVVELRRDLKIYRKEQKDIKEMLNMLVSKNIAQNISFTEKK